MDEKELERLIKLEATVETHDKTINAHSAILNELKSSVAQQDIRNVRIETKIDYLTEKFEAFDKRVAKIDEQITNDKTEPARQLYNMKWSLINKIVVGIGFAGTVALIASVINRV